MAKLCKAFALLALFFPISSSWGFELFVTHNGSDTVGVIDGVSDELVAEIRVGKGPSGVVVSDDGERVDVAFSAGVAVIDPKTRSVLRTLPLDPARTGHESTTDLALTPGGKRLFVGLRFSGGPDAVAVLDADRGGPPRLIRVGEFPFSLSLSPDRTQIFVVDHDSYQISVIDAKKARLSRTISLQPHSGQGVFEKPHYLAASPSGRYLYLPFQGERMIRVDIKEDRVQVFPMNIRTHQHGIAISRDGARLYVVNSHLNRREKSSLSVLSTSNLAELSRIPTGDVHEQVALSPGEDKAYLTGGFFTGWHNHVTVVDLRKNRVLKRISVGPRPLAIVVLDR
ncbi:MAG: hypothetical protein ACE5JS_16710 [Nitrospinota bacterium]